MTQKFPDSQKEPFGPKQLAWIERYYGKAFFRKGEKTFNPCVKPEGYVKFEPTRAP